MTASLLGTGPAIWPSAWFPGLDPVAPARLRLVCFSYAGGSPSLFRAWSSWLGPDVQVVPLLLPGRGFRVGEQPYRSLRTLVGDAADALESAGLVDDYAVFGHSMGALLGYELSCELVRRGFPSPLHLFVSGSRPPHLYGAESKHTLDDASLRAMVHDLGGLAGDGFLADAFLDRRMPVLRADLAVCETYRWQPQPLLAVPMTSFAGAADPIATPAQMNGWRDYTSRSFVSRTVPGNHFFLSGDALARVLGQLRDDLRRLLTDPPTTPASLLPATSSQGMTL